MRDWLAEALSSATELARRRGQTPSTAHVLVALYRFDSSVLALCAQFGLRDVRLAAELVFVDERPHMIEVMVARANKLAAAMGMHRVLPLHVLHVLAHERHCAANRVLQRLDVVPAHLGQAALDRLEGANAQQPLAAAVYDFGEAEFERRNHTATQRQHRAYVAAIEEQRERARANALWLGDEVEKRLPRRGARPLDRPPPTFADEVEAKLRRRR
jgi:ATP-dependent Clp protease ATP-binding subunit ClpA